MSREEEEAMSDSRVWRLAPEQDMEASSRAGCAG